jgi:hypothetical protein
VHRNPRIAELRPGPAGIGSRAGHEPAVLEQEDAGALDLAQLGELPAGGGEQLVHRPGVAGRLDEPEEDLGVREATLVGAAGPGLGGRGGELRAHLPQEVWRGGGCRFDREDADDLAVEDQRFAVRALQAEAGHLLVGGPPAVGAGHHRLLLADDAGEERRLVQGDRDAQPRVVVRRLRRLRRDLTEGDHHLGGGFVHPYRDAGGPGRGAQAREDVLHGGEGVVRGRRVRGSLHRGSTHSAIDGHAIKIGIRRSCLSSPTRGPPSG